MTKIKDALIKSANLITGVQLRTNIVSLFKEGLWKHNPGSGVDAYGCDCGFDINRGATVARFINNTGGVIPPGPVSSFGIDAVAELPNGVISDADNPLHVLGYLGITPKEVAIGAEGIAVYVGAVIDQDTSGVAAEGFVYLASGGGYTQTRPLYPTGRLLVGGVLKKDALVGKIGAKPLTIARKPISKSYSFTSTGVNAGTYWEAGFYDFASADANLNQGALTQDYGVVGRTYAAHAAIVAAGAGVVDTGVVGLRVTGIKDNEDGTQTAAQTDIITEDITTLEADTYYETGFKFSGDVTFELYVVSGTPVNFSLDFNYGYVKYEDFEDTDVTITEFENKWRGNAADVAFDIALMHHKATGWTHAAAGFVPGNGDICRRSIDQALAGDVANDGDGAYKRLGFNQYIQGSQGEGLLVQIITGANGTVQTLDTHITGVSEGL